MTCYIIVNYIGFDGRGAPGRRGGAAEKEAGEHKAKMARKQARRLLWLLECMALSCIPKRIEQEGYILYGDGICGMCNKHVNDIVMLTHRSEPDTYKAFCMDCLPYTFKMATERVRRDLGV